jgi:hypothetical protein
MTDNPTRAKMAILNLTPDEIIEAIKLLPGPSDWRELAVGTDANLFKAQLGHIADTAMEATGLVHVGTWFDINTAAYSFKCTPAQARVVADLVERDYSQKLNREFLLRLEKAYGDRPHNPETMELIFDDNEIP